MNNFRDYYLFYNVYRHRSITKAASETSLTKSTVSRAVTRLEKEYGLKLFFRNGKALHSTRFGDHLYQYCEKILDLFWEAKNSSIQFKNECCGTIKIAAPVLFGQTLLSPIIARFSEKFPKAHLHVSLSNDLSENEYPDYDLVFSLRNNIGDHYIVKDIGSIYTKLFWSRNYRNMNSKEMGNNHFLILTSKNADEPFKLKIHHEKQSSPARELFVRPRILSNDSKIIKEAVIKGLGIGILPGHEVSDLLDNGVLEEAFYSHYVYHDNVYAIYSSFLMMPKLFKVFLDFVSVELSLDLQINREAYSR
jgi:DNA-binding transcriptional LysR family regulator